jgi:hypothetical protein
MSTLTAVPDTKFSKQVFALVAHDFEYNDEVHYRTDGHHIRTVFVNKADAEVALNDFTLQSLKDFSFEGYCYNVSDLLPGNMSKEDFCEKANKKFGRIFTLDPQSLDPVDLDEALKKLSDEQKIAFLKMLGFSFGKVIKTNMLGE